MPLAGDGRTLVRTHAVERGHGPFPFFRDARADEVSEVLGVLLFKMHELE
jgi:hypothetical protein